MRHIYYILAAVIPALFLAGCIKPGIGLAPGNPGSSSLLVKSVVTISYDTTTQTQNAQSEIDYQYDSKNRKSSTTETNNITENGTTTTANSDFTFSYATGVVTESGTVTINNVPEQETAIYYTNSAGTEMDSTTISEVSGGVTEFVLRQVLAYNSSGNCIAVNTTEDFTGAPTQSTTQAYLYSGNDVTQVNVTNSGSGVTVNSSSAYAYNGTKGNLDAVGISFLPIFFGQTFDLPISMTAFGSGVSNTTNYAYTIDSQNRVTAITGTSATGMLLLQETVTYEN